LNPIINRNAIIEVILSGNREDDEDGIESSLRERLANRFYDFTGTINIHWGRISQEKFELILHPRPNAGRAEFNLDDGPNGRSLIEQEIEEFFEDRRNI
jgi:hypothetical protein